MKIKSLIIFAMMMVPMFFFGTLRAQQQSSLFPNGFHIGVTGEGNVAQKVSSIRYAGECLPPSSVGVTGWKAGVEFSYHFYNYFGVSVGLTYGTIAQFKTWEYERSTGYFAFPLTKRYCGLQMPCKFEFHFPIKQTNWSFYGTLGVNLVDFTRAIMQSMHKDDPSWDFSRSITYNKKTDRDYFHTMSDENSGKVKVEALLNLGIYYRLPYNDLLRFGVVANLSFRDRFQGYYLYRYEGKDYGTLSYRHNYLGLELSYIHCFSLKAERVARKMEKY